MAIIQATTTTTIEAGDDYVFLNDCPGTTTAAANTAFTRILPPSEKGRLCSGTFGYLGTNTAHTLTFLTAVQELRASSEAASGQATLVVNQIPTDPSGGDLATTDYFVVQHQDGTYGAYLWSSDSGTTITFGSNLTDKVLKGARVFFMGGPADHAVSQWTMPASTLFTWPAGDFRARSKTASSRFSPILVHSNNATNAGVLYGPAYFYDGD
jgi:hypothetical protein